MDILSGLFDYIVSFYRPLPALIGVRHRCLDEIAMVESYIPSFVQRIGIELPVDYEDMEKKGVPIFYFGELARRLKEKSLDVIALESRGLYRAALAISGALQIRKCEAVGIKSSLGSISSRADLVRDIKWRKLGITCGDPYRAPELTRDTDYAFSHFLAADEDILYALDRYPTPESAQFAMDQLTIRRDRYMLDIIIKEGLSLAVVGAAHARNMMDGLTGYRFIQT